MFKFRDKNDEIRESISGYVDEKFIFFSRNFDIFTDKQNIFIFLGIVCGEMWDRLYAKHFLT